MLMPQQNRAPLPRSLSEALCEQSEPWKVARLSDREQGCKPRSLPLARREISILERSHPILITLLFPARRGALGGQDPAPWELLAQLGSAVGASPAAQTDTWAKKHL